MIDAGVSFRATLYVEMAVKPTPRNRRLRTLSDGRSSQARVGATGERSVAPQLGDDACQCTCVCLCYCCVQCNILAGARIPLSDSNVSLTLQLSAICLFVVLQIAAANAAPTWAAFAAGWASDIALIILHIFGAARIAKCNEAFAIRAELRVIGTAFAWLQVGTGPKAAVSPSE